MYNFSIIIPHKDSYDLLIRCLDSIPCRDDLQVIVVDDNSTQSVLDNLKKSLSLRKNIVLIPLVNEKGGAGHARNVGLAQAQGRWILFADCDDEYSANLNDMLDKYLDSDYDVVYYDYIFKFDKKESGPICAKNLTNGNKEDYLKYKVLAPWNKMVKKSLITVNKIRFEECSNGNDIFYSFQVGVFSKNVDFFHSVIYYYYRNVQGITNQKKNNDSYYLCLFEHLYKCNMFYRYIGHKSWCRSVFVELIAIVYRQGFRASLQAAGVFIKNKKEITENKNGFISYFFCK